jgi:hypothetical protein
MTISEVVIPLSLGSLSILWLATTPLRRPRKLEDLLAEVNTDLADRLLLILQTQSFGREQHLQDAIGGWKGILEIHKQAGYIASIAHLLANGPVENAPELEEIVLSSIYLRFITPFCLLELVFREIFSLVIRSTSTHLSIPRVTSWGYARLYCDMVGSMAAALADNDVQLGASKVVVL